MPNTWRGIGTGAPSSEVFNGVGAGSSAEAAQSTNSCQRAKIACGSKSNRPELAKATSTAPLVVIRHRRPATFAMRIGHVYTKPDGLPGYGPSHSQARRRDQPTRTARSNRQPDDEQDHRKTGPREREA